MITRIRRNAIIEFIADYLVQTSPMQTFAWIEYSTIPAFVKQKQKKNLYNT